MTRTHIVEVAKEWVDQGRQLVSGGGGPEKLIPGPNGGAKGGAYGDIVLRNTETGQAKIINTVDTYADGVTATAREASNADKIAKLVPDAEVVMIPKPKAGAVLVGGAAVFGAGSDGAADGSDSGISWDDVKSTYSTVKGAVGDFIHDVATDPLTYVSTKLNVAAMLLTPTSLGGCNSSGVCSDMINYAGGTPDSTFSAVRGALT